MDDTTLWWILAGVLIAAELTTGSFYLLMLALGATAGALAGHLSLSGTAQVVLAAASGGLATAGWYLFRRSRGGEAPDIQSDRNVNLDIGETVQVLTWDEQGRTQVQYRGANWSARYVGSAPARPGPHRIAKLHGNQLELESL